MLMDEVKLTDWGAASPQPTMSKEDERSVMLAERAQKGDYDDGKPYLLALVQYSLKLCS
jgi:hypothetical protein